MEKRVPGESTRTQQMATTATTLLSVGDVVLIQDDNSPHSMWSMGRVTEVVTDKLGCVRAMVLRTAMGVLRRLIYRLVTLLQYGQKSEL